MKNYELTFGPVQTHVNLIDIEKSCKMSLPLQKIGFGTADNGPSKVRITNTGPSNSLCQVHTPDDASPLPRRHSAIRSSLAIACLNRMKSRIDVDKNHSKYFEIKQGMNAYEQIRFIAILQRSYHSFSCQRPTAGKC